MYRLVVDLLHPFRLLFLLSLLGVVGLWYRRRECRRRLLLLTVPFVALTLLCTPAVGYLALGSLEWQYPPLARRPADTEAIVVLAGGTLTPYAYRARAQLAPNSVFRCLHAVEVYRQGPRRPIVVSGGEVDEVSPGITHARAMRDFLVELGIAPSDIIEEDRSRTTAENAAESAKILRDRGVRRVVLVTEATHMPRAMRAFRKQGVEAVASGCHYRSTRLRLDPFEFLPSPTAASKCQEAFHEWLGLAWYLLRGRA